MACVIQRFLPMFWSANVACVAVLAFVVRDWPARDLAALPVLFVLNAVIWLLRRK